MSTHFPAEWHPQSAIQLTWPHADTDWNWVLADVHLFYLQLTKTLLQFEDVIICAHDDRLANQLRTDIPEAPFKAHIYVAPCNDTWARDHGPISVFENGKLTIKDFTFNGWGNKFDARLDNDITHKLHSKHAYNAHSLKRLNFIMEGGSIESDGHGSLLTTKHCLLNPNRNPSYSQEDVERVLKTELGIEIVLWLNHGELEGDDTDAHIDTLARLCPNNVIVYQGCTDQTDPHFSELQAMKGELEDFRNHEGQPFKLHELPLPNAMYEIEEDGSKVRLPATYANFLFVNGAVIMPIYNSPQDSEAIRVMKQALPEHQIIPMDCSILVRQYGSLHCITMQIPDASDAL